MFANPLWSVGFELGPRKPFSEAKTYSLVSWSSLSPEACSRMVTMGLPSEFRPVWKIFEEAGDCAWSKLQKLNPRMRKKIKRACMVEVSLTGWQTTGMTQKSHVKKDVFHTSSAKFRPHARERASVMAHC